MMLKTLTCKLKKIIKNMNITYLYRASDREMQNIG